MMDNMRIYNAAREVPNEAKKSISGGKLKGMTDINPMWRIKRLTEIFGPCGIGWYPELLEKHIEEGAKGERVAIVDIALYIKDSGEWSKPIYGTGGSMLVNTEKGQLVSSDEAYKMAYTDAISVCCKMLGVGADVYWDKDATKYSPREEASNETKKDKPGYRYAPANDPPVYCVACNKRFPDFFDGEKLIPAAELKKRSESKYGKGICPNCLRSAGDKS